MAIIMRPSAMHQRIMANLVWVAGMLHREMCTTVVAAHSTLPTSMPKKRRRSSCVTMPVVSLRLSGMRSVVDLSLDVEAAVLDGRWSHDSQFRTDLYRRLFMPDDVSPVVRIRMQQRPDLECRWVDDDDIVFFAMHMSAEYVTAWDDGYSFDWTTMTLFYACCVLRYMRFVEDRIVGGDLDPPAVPSCRGSGSLHLHQPHRTVMTLLHTSLRRAAERRSIRDSSSHCVWLDSISLPLDEMLANCVGRKYSHLLIRALTTRTTSVSRVDQLGDEEDLEDRCAICLDRLVDIPMHMLRITECGHVFCAECLVRTRPRTTCSLCARDVRRLISKDVRVRKTSWTQ